MHPLCSGYYCDRLPFDAEVARRSDRSRVVSRRVVTTIYGYVTLYSEASLTMNLISVFDAIVFRALMHCTVCRDYVTVHIKHGAIIRYRTPLRQLQVPSHHVTHITSQVHYKSQCDEIKTY